MGVKLFPFKFKINEENKFINIIKNHVPVIDFRKKNKNSSLCKYDLFQIFIDEFDTLLTIVATLTNFITGIFKSPDRNYLNISLRGGFGLPDITGIFYGLIESLRSIKGESISIAYHPDFYAESIKGDIALGAVVRLNRLLKEMILLAWRLPKMQMIKIYNKYRKGV